MKVSQKKQKEFKKQMTDLLAEAGFTVVSGKGSFKQGSCLVLHENKIVVNTFLPMDLQIKFLYDFFVEQEMTDKLPDDIAKFATSVGGF